MSKLQGRTTVVLVVSLVSGGCTDHAAVEPTALKPMVIEAASTASTTTNAILPVGALSFVVSGLPQGAPANIGIVGPSGFSSIATSSGTWTSRALGTYTATARPVIYAGITYIPTPASSVRTVSANATTAVTVAYVAQVGTLKVVMVTPLGGVVGYATVSGPNTAGVPIVGSGTLTNRPVGLYTIVAKGATFAGYTYQPTPSTAVVAVSANMTTTVQVSYALVKPPVPTLTRASQTSASPGTIVHLFGTNFQPPGVVVPPVVMFDGGNGLVYSQYPQVVSNSELTFVVAPRGGAARIWVEASGAKSNALQFMYQSPSINTLSPNSGGRGATVTITGLGFGSAALSAGVIFGKSAAQVVQWTDQRVVVIAPSDFGEGTGTDILKSATGCIASFESAGFTKFIVQKLLGSCNSLVANVFKVFQLNSYPGFSTKAVDVSIRTGAGTSNKRTFTYQVQVENR